MTTSWRYTCPEGHAYSQVRSYEKTDKRYYCNACAERYTHLWDKKEERKIRRIGNE